MAISDYIIWVMHLVCENYTIRLISRSRASVIFKPRLGSHQLKQCVRSYSHTQPSVAVLDCSPKDALWGPVLVVIDVQSPDTVLPYLQHLRVLRVM